MIKKVLIINGVERTLVLEGTETLAKVLRERLMLTGCKIGCGEGHCGACNVIVDGKVTRSCITKVTKLRDYAEITTIEGIGTVNNLHPIQVAWMAYGLSLIHIFRSLSLFLTLISPSPAERCARRDRAAHRGTRRRAAARRPCPSPPCPPAGLCRSPAAQDTAARSAPSG